MTTLTDEIVRPFAEAWASVDGRLEMFLRCETNEMLEEAEGCFEGYMADAKELLERAISRGALITVRNPKDAAQKP